MRIRQHLRECPCMLPGASAPAAPAAVECTMDWQTDTTRERYTLPQGTCRCLVWRHGHGGWAAFVSRDGTAVRHDSFFVLEEAQAWCGYSL